SDWSSDVCSSDLKIAKGTVSANDASFADSVSFGCGDTGAQTVTLQVKDAAGNAGTCQATVTVSDSSLPTALCQNIAVSLDATGHVSVNATAIENGSTDNCGVTEHKIAKGTVSANDASFADSVSFGCGDTGAQTVTLQVKEAAGNAGTCQATVTVSDSSLPTGV